MSSSSVRATTISAIDTVARHHRARVDARSSERIVAVNSASPVGAWTSKALGLAPAARQPAAERHRTQPGRKAEGVARVARDAQTGAGTLAAQHLQGPLDRNPADCRAVLLDDGHVDQPQSQFARRQEPAFTRTEPLRRQLRRPARPGQRALSAP